MYEDWFVITAVFHRNYSWGSVEDYIGYSKHVLLLSEGRQP